MFQVILQSHITDDGSKFEFNSVTQENSIGLISESVGNQFTRSRFAHNSAQGEDIASQGKALYLIQSEVQFKLVEMEGNTADSSIINVYMMLSTLNVTDSVFFSTDNSQNGITDSTATGYYVYAFDSHIQIENSTFSDGHAYQGGALFIIQSSLEMQSTSFLNNIAHQSGGAIFAQSSLSLKAEN